jgi:NHLM bacteriocin system ABC transporter ATP-binding protein
MRGSFGRIEGIPMFPETKLEQGGTAEAPAPNVPFAVEDANSVWIVERGKLDLFLVSGVDGQATGARYPVMRIDEGGAVFGIGTTLPAGRHLIATALPETKLLRFSVARFRDMALLNSESPAVHLLEGWISRLSNTIVDGPWTGDFVAVEAGAPVAVGEEKKVIVPKEGVIWVAHLEGTSRFAAKGPVPSVPEQFFPVSRHGWLEVAPHSLLQCIDSRTLYQLDNNLRALQAFHSVAISCLIDKQQNESAKERERQRAKYVNDSSVVRRALIRLATPLRRVSPVVQSEEGIEDPLFLAAEAVGKKLGVKLKPHWDMLRGVKVADPIAAIARASGVRVRRVQLKAGWWRQDTGPLLAFRDVDRRPLALLPRSARAYDAYDPIEQSTMRVTAEVSSALNPLAYMFYRPFPPKRLNIADLLKFGLSDCRKELLSILLMGIAAGLLGTITPYATGIIFDHLIPGAERRQLVHVALILLVIALTAAMFTLTRSFAVLRLQGKIDKALQAAVWDRLLSLPVPFFRNYTSGDLASRSLGIVWMSRILTGSTLTVILSGVFSVFLLGSLYYYSWELALLGTGLVLFAWMMSAVCIYVQVRYQREMFRLAGRISGLLLELVNGVAKFRVAAVENRAFASWAREFAEQKQISMRARRLSNRLTVFNAAFPVISLGAIFYCEAVMLSRPQVRTVTTGEFVAFLAAFTQFLMASLLVSSSLQSVFGIVPLYERAQPIFHTLPEVAQSTSDPGRLSGSIEISHVTFRYRPDLPLVLWDVSASIQPGQFVAFVGASGSGKSTLLRLLLGFETPESGTIYFDGQDLDGLDVEAVRRQMGVVLQNSRLINGDIFTNIVGSSPLSMDDAWEAASLVGLDDDIVCMPMGMYTLIGDGGGGVSGGQRQRLMIARALVGKPRILLMDEATSALDNETQSVVSRSLESLQVTRVVIAHRLSTILNADRIFVIDKGSVVQAGTYKELLDQEGLFREFAKRQLA